MATKILVKEIIALSKNIALFYQTNFIIYFHEDFALKLYGKRIKPYSLKPAKRQQNTKFLL